MRKKVAILDRLQMVFFLSWMVMGNSALFPLPLATGHSKFLGCASDVPIQSNFDMYWNQFTPENSGKWGSVEGTRDQYSWTSLDQAYQYAKQRGFVFKFHTLIWGNQQPSWISNLSDEEKREEIEEWIRLVGERYPDMDLVDVVNEPLPSHNPPDGRNGRANYQDAIGGKGKTGYDWVIWSFAKARQYLPNAKLLINDYGIINDNSATSEYLKIINLLKERGLIDGIGVQGHRFEFESADTTTLKNNLTRLAATGLPIYISEFDLGNYGDSGTPNDATQLRLYQKIFPLIWKHPGVQGITLWGYVENRIWQRTCYLVRSDGSERPALEWLRAFLTPPGSYRSYQSGLWNDVNTWERYNGTTWVTPVPFIPSWEGSLITIQKGHTITFTGADSLDQLVIAPQGELVISPEATLLVRDGEGTDLTSYGTIRNFGKIEQKPSATFKAMTGSRYIHQQDGGIIPRFMWQHGSTLELNSLKTHAPSNGNQYFHHVVWDCPDQTADLTLGWNGNTIGGDITVRNTGTGQWQMCAPALGEAVVLTIMGSIIQSGGQFTATGTDNPNTNITIHHYGNLLVTGGDFSISRGSQGGSGTTVWNFMGDRFRLSHCTMQNANPFGAKFVFSKKGIQTLTLETDNTILSFPIEISEGTTLNLGISRLTGSGMFLLHPGATLELAHPGGLDEAIRVTGPFMLSKRASFVYSGTIPQITGTFLPDTVNHFVINNPEGVTLSHSVTVNGTLELQNGALFLGNNSLHYGPEASLKYSGKYAQTTTDAELPQNGEPKNLIINNLAGVTLHASRTFKGSLELGGKLILGSNTLTAATANMTGPMRYVVTGTGMLRLTQVGSVSPTLFPVGTNLYAPVWIKNTGTPDTIGVSVIPDTTSTPFGGRVMVKWNIVENSPGGGNYTLTFGWMRQLENNEFRTPDRTRHAHIFLLDDTTEAGSGEYIFQFNTQPYTCTRGGITQLGWFAVGRFKDVPDAVEQREANTPYTFALYQNYPNPFNGSTSICFTLPKNCQVKILVYDLLGKEVATLVDTQMSAGKHMVHWNPEDLPSGVYIYKFITKDFIQTRKMALLK